MGKIIQPYTDTPTSRREQKTVSPSNPLRAKKPRVRAPEPFGILAIHASAAHTSSGALIFLGASGTGKSTICRLLSADTQLLADDKVYLIPGDGVNWTVADASARALKGVLSEREACSLAGPRLRAIFRIYQSPEPKLSRLDVPTTCLHLTNAAFELPWQRNFDVGTKKLMYTQAANITRNIPGYRLHFDLSDKLFEMIHREIN